MDLSNRTRDEYSAEELRAEIDHLKALLKSEGWAVIRECLSRNLGGLSFPPATSLDGLLEQNAKLQQRSIMLWLESLPENIIEQNKLDYAAKLEEENEE